MTEPFTRAGQARTALAVGHVLADLTERRITPATRNLLDIQRRYGVDGTHEAARLLAWRILDTRNRWPVDPDHIHTTATDLLAALLGSSFTPGRTYFQNLLDAHPHYVRYLSLHFDDQPEAARTLWTDQHQTGPKPRIPALLSLLATTAALSAPLVFTL